MWWLYTHDCIAGTWSLITSQEAVLPADGEPLEIPAELRAAGGHFYGLGFHVGLRFTTLPIVGPNKILSNAAARMVRVVSLTSTRPWNCKYEEPADDRRPILIYPGHASVSGGSFIGDEEDDD